MQAGSRLLRGRALSQRIRPIEIVASAFVQHRNGLIPGGRLSRDGHRPVDIVSAHVGKHAESLMRSESLRVAIAVIKIVPGGIMQHTDTPIIAAALAEFATLVTIIPAQVNQRANPAGIVRPDADADALAETHVGRRCVVSRWHRSVGPIQIGATGIEQQTKTARSADALAERVRNVNIRLRIPVDQRAAAVNAGTQRPGRALVAIRAGSVEQQTAYAALLLKVKVAPDIISKWEAAVPDIALLDTESMQKRLDWLNAQLTAQTTAA